MTAAVAVAGAPTTIIGHLRRFPRPAMTELTREGYGIGSRGADLAASTRSGDRATFGQPGHRPSLLPSHRSPNWKEIVLPSFNVIW